MILQQRKRYQNGSLHLIDTPGVEIPEKEFHNFMCRSISEASDKKRSLLISLKCELLTRNVVYLYAHFQVVNGNER